MAGASGITYAIFTEGRSSCASLSVVYYSRAVKGRSGPEGWRGGGRPASEQVVSMDSQSHDDCCTARQRPTQSGVLVDDERIKPELNCVVKK